MSRSVAIGVVRVIARRWRVVSVSVSGQPVECFVDKLTSQQATPAGINHGDC